MNTIMTNKNFETYSFIWLDNLVNNSQENLQAQKILRQTINHLLTFENDQLCLQYISSLADDDRIIFIISGDYSQTIIPQISYLRQIVSIYIYCKDKQVHVNWTQNFPKVNGIFIQLNELVQQIQVDHNQRHYHRIDEVLAINIFKTNLQNQEQSSTGLNGQFIYSQLLIDCLIRMNTSLSNDKKQLIDFCKEYYKNNLNELKIIEEFDENYSSKRAIWWYTRDSFLYRLLNKALRIQNIDLLFLMRFLIHDIGQQLENYQCSTPIKVYRAQQMSSEEIEILKNSIGEFISINSFFSTSLNRYQTEIFQYTSDSIDGIEQVFFEIYADPKINQMKAFSQITKLSYFPNEEEVLFMIGSIFRLDRIQYDQYKKIWNIQMTLCSNNNNPQIQTLIQYMKNELGTGETNVLIFGQLLRKMSKFDHAEKYFQRFLKEYSSDELNIAHCYHALGLLADNKGDYDTSLNWYKKSLKIFIRILDFNDTNIANSHNSIAITYQNKGDYTHALESYEKALNIWKRTLGEDHPNIAICLNNMGNVYRNDKEYSKALECVEKALNILQKHLPADHSDLASSYGSIGNIHLCLGHYDQALKYYNQSLKIYEKSLPFQHPNIAMTLNNIGTVYEDRNQYQQALNCFQQAANIYRHSLPSTHPNIIQIEQNIKRISIKIK